MNSKNMGKWRGLANWQSKVVLVAVFSSAMGGIIGEEICRWKNAAMEGRKKSMKEERVGDKN